MALWSANGICSKIIFVLSLSKLSNCCVACLAQLVPAPVAMPRRSGNHLTRVETGEIYRDRAHASKSAQAQPDDPELMQVDAERRHHESAAPQHTAATRPAFRGPSRSSHPPNSAADRPSTTMPIVNVHNKSLTRQLQVVVNSESTSVMVLHDASGSPEIDLLSGNQKTLSP